MDFPRRITDFKKNNEEIYSFNTGAYFTTILMDKYSHPQRELWVCGHNYNKEIGDYSEEYIDRFTEFGYKIKRTDLEEQKESKLVKIGKYLNLTTVPIQVTLTSKIKNVYPGNGILILEIN